MSPRPVPGHPDVSYLLISFDKHGKEEKVDGELVSQQATKEAADAVTDIFLLSHGWKGDVRAALRQCDKWIGAMADLPADRERIRLIDEKFKPLILGLHWPSLPWGDERLDSGVLGEADDAPPTDQNEFTAEAKLDEHELIDRFADRLADTPDTRQALETILSAPDDPELREALNSNELPGYLNSAYATLFADTGTSVGHAAATPGDDIADFNPAVSLQDWTQARPKKDPSLEADVKPDPQPDGDLLGFGDWLNATRQKLKDAVLMPVRQLSFLAMKRRARLVGETGVHELLKQLQAAAPQARIHLMGHSFGCIVVTAAVAGPVVNGNLNDQLNKPVDAMLLAQGALSLWSYADTIPYLPNQHGYYEALIQARPPLINGPIVTTQSWHDHAVGTFYPLASAASGEVTLDNQYPEYGGVGAFGIQGTTSTNIEIAAADTDYDFETGHTYNVDSSSVIKNGAWPSGAHSDIAHEQVAHLMWQAVNAAANRPDN